MQNILIKLNTLTPLVYLHSCNILKFAVYKNIIYIINPNKFSTILSLMKLSANYTAYQNYFKTNNITQWLNSNQMLFSEILEEISLCKIPKINSDDIDTIYTFIDYKNKFISYTLTEYLTYFLRKIFKNIILCSYIYNNLDEFNKYLREVFNYYNKSKLQEKFLSQKDIINCIFQSEQIKISKELNSINDINIKSFILNNKNNMSSLYKLLNNASKEYRICLNKNEIIFNLEYDKNNYFMKNIQKYAENMNIFTKIIMQQDINMLNIFEPAKSHKNKLSKSIINQCKILNSNFYALNKQNILDICTYEENKTNLSNIFNIPANKPLFILNNSNNILTNYSVIEKIT